MARLARSNKYLRSDSLEKIVRENASTSTAFEGVRAEVRGGAVHYKRGRAVIVRSKKRAKES